MATLARHRRPEHQCKIQANGSEFFVRIGMSITPCFTATPCDSPTRSRRDCSQVTTLRTTHHTRVPDGEASPTWRGAVLRGHGGRGAPREPASHRCVKANTPRLLATATSGLPSPFRSATVTCVPTPLSSSIFSATYRAPPEPSRSSRNQSPSEVRRAGGCWRGAASLG